MNDVDELNDIIRALDRKTQRLETVIDELTLELNRAKDINRQWVNKENNRQNYPDSM